MKDGYTRKLAAGRPGQEFLARHAATLVFAAGPLAGTEVALDRERITVGRHSDADVVIPDDSVSHLHAALELAEAGFRLRDLGSTNGVKVNGSRVAAADLKHGDRLELGKAVFRYLAVERKAAPPVHHLRDE
jgi:pSer/pThr/pTyr-binding forkhead associated (FHA) protein